MKASSVSLGKRKPGPCTSISVSFAPNERNAFATPAPVAKETARSELGPPSRTAILFPVSVITLAPQANRVVSRGSPFLPHDLHFGFQFNPPLFPRDCLDLPDQ